MDPCGTPMEMGSGSDDTPWKSKPEFDHGDSL